MKRIDVVIGIVIRSGRVLICQRRADDPVLGGYWEFPGGKLEAQESREQGLIRELAEELAIRVRPTEALPVIEHDYPTVHVRLHPYLCEHMDGEAQPLACEQVIWILPGDLARYRFPPANVELIHTLIRRLAPSL